MAETASKNGRSCQTPVAFVPGRVAPCIVLTRFAPAPTGYLHLGHVVNALYVWGLAEAGAGRVRLRIEDHDRQRSRPAFETAILEDLAWLGFEPHGPITKQSERDGLYRAALDVLQRQGLVYGCSCTRADLQAVPDGTAGERRYPNTCRRRRLGLDEGLGWRVRLEAVAELFDDGLLGPQSQDPAAQCGDLLIRDRLGNWTYQFAVVVDDLEQGITDVIRGQDLLSSTGRQIQLARLLGRPEPPRFTHHPLVMKSPSVKLSKSDGATGVRELRAAGWTAREVLDRAAVAGALGPNLPAVERRALGTSHIPGSAN
jgi:glutamyl-Q tRNA(Asp) synthetase